MTIASTYLDLFRGNPIAVGTEEGGCLRRLHPDPNWWQHRVEEHLHGTSTPIGVYPMMQNYASGDWCVHFGVVDFDEGEDESWIHALNISKVLTKFGVTSWIERSRSKGYHVWVFDTPGDYRPAAFVRRGLWVAAQLAGAPTKEVNPKQESLLEGQLGNYIRLPYPGWLGTVSSPERRIMVSANGVRFTLEHFVRVATYSSGLDGLADLGKLYVEKKKFDVGKVEYDPETSTVNEDLVALMSRKAFVIWRDGPLEGSDRSSTLYRFAGIMNEDGIIEPEEALTLLRDADARWGKQFESRPGGLKYLVDCINKTFDVEIEVDE